MPILFQIAQTYDRTGARFIPADFSPDAHEDVIWNEATIVTRQGIISGISSLLPRKVVTVIPFGAAPSGLTISNENHSDQLSRRYDNAQ
ncbi:MAG: hypothetical protein WAR76_16785 [Xanthobacteraceae bacterium]